jgi:hypothetical protein
MPGAEPDFDEFNHDAAWELGCALVGHCRAHSYAVTISIHIGQQRVFHAALPGSSADNDDCVMRKTRVVQRFDRASQEVGRTYTVGDTGAFHPAFALPASRLRADRRGCPDPHPRHDDRSPRHLRPEFRPGSRPRQRRAAFRNRQPRHKHGLT